MNLNVNVNVNLNVHLISSVSAETLRILTWEGVLTEAHQQKLINLTKQKFGVDLKLELTYVHGTDDFFPGLRAGKADMIISDHYVYKDERFRLIKHRLVLPLELKNIPNHTKVYPVLQMSDFYTENGKCYAIPLGHGPYGLAYNTAIVRDGWPSSGTGRGQGWDRSEMIQKADFHHPSSTPYASS